MDESERVVNGNTTNENNNNNNSDNGNRNEIESQEVKKESWLRQWFSQFRNGSNPRMARYVYALFFLLATFLAWAARDYGRTVLTEMERLKICDGGKDCLGVQGVLRVSLGCFTFYFIMFLTTVGTSKLNDRRSTWQSGWWSVKILLGIGLFVVPFFIPSSVIRLYGEIAHFGAGVFLLIQLISVISFISWMNDCCRPEENRERCQIHVMLVAITAYVLCIAGIVTMYILYSKGILCRLNFFFVTWTLVLLILMTNLSLHPRVNAGILAPGLMGLYVVFICWCAIRSEPAGENCLKQSTDSKKTDWLTIISFIIAVLAMVIATFSTGIDSQCFQFKREKPKTVDDVPYGYGFFHFVFATGAMYLAMLLISWNPHHAMRKWTIDVGWTSCWVRIVNEWLAVCVYLWWLWENAQRNT